MKHYLTLTSNYVNLAVVHPGYLSPHGAQAPQEAYFTNLASLQEICDFAADFGILVAIENMPDLRRSLENIPTRCLRCLNLLGAIT